MLWNSSLKTRACSAANFGCAHCHVEPPRIMQTHVLEKLCRGVHASRDVHGVFPVQLVGTRRRVLCPLCDVEDLADRDNPRAGRTNVPGLQAPGIVGMTNSLEEQRKNLAHAIPATRSINSTEISLRRGSLKDRWAIGKRILTQIRRPAAAAAAASCRPPAAAAAAAAAACCPPAIWGILIRAFAEMRSDIYQVRLLLWEISCFYFCASVC